MMHKAAHLLLNKIRNTSKSRKLGKKIHIGNSLKTAKFLKKSAASLNNKSQSSLKSKLLAEITNRVSKLSKKFKLRAKFEKNAIKLKFNKIKKENSNPALRADKCMTFQNIFFKNDKVGKASLEKLDKDNESKKLGDLKDGKLSDEGDGELNAKEQEDFITELKKDPLFEKDETLKATLEECMNHEKIKDTKDNEGTDKDNPDDNGLIDIDEALVCNGLKNDDEMQQNNCRTDTNQLGSLYSRRIKAAVLQINGEIKNLTTKRTVIEEHLEAVNNQLRALQDELDEDTAIYKTKETMNSVQLAMVNMRLNKNLNIKHEINNWLPNEGEGVNDNKDNAVVTEAEETPEDKEKEKAEAVVEAAGGIPPFSSNKIGEDWIIQDSTEPIKQKFKNGKNVNDK